MRPGGHPVEDGEPGTGVREGRAQPHGSQATAEGAFSAGTGEESIRGQHVQRGLEGVSHPCRAEASAARALSLRWDGGAGPWPGSPAPGRAPPPGRPEPRGGLGEGEMRVHGPGRRKARVTAPNGEAGGGVQERSQLSGA